MLNAIKYDQKVDYVRNFKILCSICSCLVATYNEISHKIVIDLFDKKKKKTTKSKKKTIKLKKKTTRSKKKITRSKKKIKRRKKNKEQKI